ncbi:MAG: hypothetical protein EOP06_16805 [Proteobacteria bacterium]|nr:MAG: hypothetical protein EOP06_16805 [Pseudomonadota bacterium]
MKKLFVIAAVTLASGAAFASKARLTALGNAEHLVDTQTIFENPADAALWGDWATFEMGTGALSYTPATANGATGATAGQPIPEGGLVRSAGDARWGFYLGHRSNTIALTRTPFNAAGITVQEENPVELFYAQKADLNWGASLWYSNSDKKATQIKQNTAGLRLGARTAVWDANLTVGIANTAKNDLTTAEVKGNPSARLGGGYYFDTLYVYGSYGMTGYKATTGGNEVSNWDANQIAVGVIDTMKKDGTDFFYGVSYHADTYKNKVGNGTKSDATYLPVVIGIEAEANTWMVLRASVTQNLILGTIKDETGLVATGAAFTEANTWENSTTVGVGTGIKLNKFTLDTTLAAATNGGMIGTDSSNFLGNASLTYMF